jgi:hypothetical protein
MNDAFRGNGSVILKIDFGIITGLALRKWKKGGVVG